MKRVSLPDGAWFDPDQAESWKSEALNDDIDHELFERLWRTKTGRWVLQVVDKDLLNPGRKERQVSCDYKDEKDIPAWFLEHGIELPAEFDDLVKDREI